MNNTLNMFNWGSYRYPKQLISNRNEQRRSPETIKITGASENQWHERVYSFIKELKTSGKITIL